MRTFQRTELRPRHGRRWQELTASGEDDGGVADADL
jgi:hypothetical protein